MHIVYTPKIALATPEIIALEYVACKSLPGRLVISYFLSRVFSQLSHASCAQWATLPCTPENAWETTQTVAIVL